MWPFRHRSKQKRSCSILNSGFSYAEYAWDFTRLSLIFVRRGVGYCNAVTRVTAGLLGRFLPRLGPLASASGPFFCVMDLVAVERDCLRRHLLRSFPRTRRREAKAASLWRSRERKSRPYLKSWQFLRWGPA